MLIDAATKAKIDIARTFRKLDSVEQAELLGELAVILAASLSDNDRRDALTFDARRCDEKEAASVNRVAGRLAAKMRGKRRSRPSGR